MSQTNLTFNSNTLIFSNVELFSGKIRPTLKFFPYEVWYDDDGDIELMSVELKDGTILRYRYFEISPQSSDIIEILSTGLTRAGLSYASQKLKHGSTGYHMFGALITGLASRALKDPDAKKYVHEQFGQLRAHFKGYINAETGQFFIAHRLNVNDAAESED